MASAIGGAVGSSVGSLAAGTFGWTAATWSQIGWTAGVMAANYLFAPDGPDITQEGPRLDDLKVTTSTYGMDIPLVYGGYRIAGNIIWALPLRETRHEEKQESGGKGGGGGSSETNIWYTYDATWAVAFCEGPITGIRRIWANGRLIFDIGSGASFESIQASSKLNTKSQIYYGDIDQNVDWTIQSNRPDSPAYRSTCYMVFSNFQLEDYGNVIPNITAEVVKSGEKGPSLYTLARYSESGYPSGGLSKMNGTRWQNFLTNIADFDLYYTNGVNGDIVVSGHTYVSPYLNRGDDGDSVYITGNHTGNNHSTNAFRGVNPEKVTNILHDHNQYLESDINGDITYRLYKPQTYGVSHATYGESDDPDIWCINTYNWKTRTSVLTTKSSSYLFYSYSWEPGNHWKYINVNYLIYKVSDTFPASDYRYEYSNGVLYYIVYNHNLTTDIGVYAPHLMTYSLPPYPLSTDPIDYYGGEDTIISKAELDTERLLDVCFYNNKIYCLVQDPLLDLRTLLIRVFTQAGVFIETIDLDTLIGLDELTADITFFDGVTKNNFILEVGSWGMFISFFTGTSTMNYKLLEGDPDTIATDYIFKDLGVMNYLDTVPVNDTKAKQLPLYNTKYNYSRNTLRFSETWAEFEVYFDTVVTTSIYLSNIVEELFLASGITSDQFDVTAGATTEVNGYVIPRNLNARQILEPLLSTYDFTIVELDFKLTLRKQNQASIENISEDDLGANGKNSIEYSISQESELIKSLTLRYANSTSDYQTSVQSIRRVDVSATEERIIELPLVLTDNKAKQIAEMNLYKNWLTRQSFAFNLPSSYKDLIAGDVVTISFDGYTKQVKITEITFTEDMVINCKAIANSYGAYESAATGSDTGGNAGETVDEVSVTTLAVLGSHTLDNAYINSEVEYVTSTGESNSWSGCSVLTKTNQNDDFLLATTLFGKNSIGTAYGTLPDHNTHIFDRTNTFEVQTKVALESTTEDDLISNGTNYALVGDEILQFADVTDLTDGRYELSNLLRGRRGTESYTSTHTERERFILLDNSAVFSIIAKTLGTYNYYTASSIGHDLSENSEIIEKTYEGKNLKPFSPEYFKGVRSGDDINLVWMRRSRYVSGYFRALPLSESTEKYTLEVYNDLDELQETIEDIILQSYTYDTTTYFASTADEVRFKVYQISNIVGMGYPSDYLSIVGV